MPPRSGRISARQQAARQRERDQARRVTNNYLKYASDFDNELRSLDFDSCESCRKRAVSSDVVRGRCGTCRRSSINLFTAENGMDIGDVPAELIGLTMIEELLIARVHPVVSVYKIRGQQRAYSGHVMNFAQHMETVATLMPQHLESIESIVLLNRDTPAGLLQFKVRPARVRAALIWLKSNNQYYSDITIDYQLLDSMPVEFDASVYLPVLQTSQETMDASEDDLEPDNLIHASGYPDVPAINADSNITRNLNQRNSLATQIVAGDWPELSQNPANEFRSEGLICRAFPVLFPYGRGDLYAPRLHSIQKHKYFKYLMQYRDGRFANDTRFPYYAYNSLARWDAINCGSVYVRLNAMEGMDATDILNRLNEPDSNIAGSIMYYGATLRGTRSFWKQRCTVLIQMIRQLGTPTIFFTLSAADYHWPDLFRILEPTIDPELLNERQRRNLMHDNPAMVAWFFNQRCDIFIKKFVMKFFAVKDFWYRFEWQHRGSPHIHGLLWIEGAPDCSDIDLLNDEEKAEIVDYFDQLISAQIGQVSAVAPHLNPCRQRFTDVAEEDRASDLDRVLSAVQRHSRCGSYCMRRRRGSRNLACRYGFPINLEDQSLLRKELGSWTFISKRNDQLLQRHNRFITQIWRGNTDFSAITSKDAVINYISKYASKGEYPSSSYSEILRHVVNRNTETTPAATLIRQLLISSVAERNYSAQETMHLLMGWPLYHASRTFVVLSLRDDWQRFGVNPNSSIVNRYSSRSGNLDDITLFMFAKNYHFSSGRMIRRRKECVVRVIPFLKLSDDLASNEEYYKMQCKLHIPWRGNFDESMQPQPSWQDTFLDHLGENNEADPFGSEFPHPPDDIEFEPEEQPDDVFRRDAGLVASRLRPNSHEIDPIGHRAVDEAHEWSSLTYAEFSVDQLREFLDNYRTAPIIARPNTNQMPSMNFSTSQAEVLSVLRSQIQDPDHDIRRIIVQGKAGTGKSAVIHAMISILNSDLQDGPNSYVVVAPTGAAAVNVDGKTIHSVFRIPVNAQLSPLNGECLRNFQLQFRTIRFIIVDEYSMVGLRLLHKIHLRLCQAKGSAERLFGGCYVYLFGDLRQLPPVRDTAIYMEPTDDFARTGLQLINSFQKYIFLTVVFRQDEEQVEFRSLLDNIATGQVTQSDWQLLMTRRKSVLAPDVLQSTFKDAVYLYPTNNQVRDHNLRVLESNRLPVAVIEGEHNNATARQGSDLLAAGLTRRLMLSIGCKIMLRRNLCVDRGLVNGSLGTVKDIIYFPDQGPPALPCVILIEFENYSGPYFVDRCFPLIPVTNTWREQSVDCSRRQFPINLAYALTIHKAQGLTLNKLVVDIGEREIAPGLSYVALSRARNLNDLVILNGFNYTRLETLGQNRTLNARETLLRVMQR